MTNTQARVIYYLSMFHIGPDETYEPAEMKRRCPDDLTVNYINSHIRSLVNAGLATEQELYPGKGYKLSPNIFDEYSKWYSAGGYESVEKWAA